GSPVCMLVRSSGSFPNADPFARNRSTTVVKVASSTRKATCWVGAGSALEKRSDTFSAMVRQYISPSGPSGLAGPNPKISDRNRADASASRAAIPIWSSMIIITLYRTAAFYFMFSSPLYQQSQSDSIPQPSRNPLVASRLEFVARQAARRRLRDADADVQLRAEGGQNGPLHFGEGAQLVGFDLKKQIVHLRHSPDFHF